MKHIFGFTVMNDVTARDRQVKMRPDGTSQYAVGSGQELRQLGADWGRASSPPTSSAIPTSWRCAPGSTTELTAETTTTATMIWSVRELVHCFSGFVTLKPGSGDLSPERPGEPRGAPTPSSAGAGASAARKDITLAGGYLKIGDVGDLRDREGIGRLRAARSCARRTGAGKRRPPRSRPAARPHRPQTPGRRPGSPSGSPAGDRGGALAV